MVEIEFFDWFGDGQCMLRTCSKKLSPVWLTFQKYKTINVLYCAVVYHATEHNIIIKTVA